jgi:hypothetical protein
MGYELWIILGFYVLVYIGFFIWYGGRGKPLSQAEVDNLLLRMEKNVAARQGQPNPALKNDFRTLASSDDGNEFIMVNLIKYREKASYPAGYTYDDDPLAADERYNAAVALPLLKRAGIPIFMSKKMGPFIDPDGSDQWDRVALVRYRSRRDLLQMAAELATKDVDVHKWASIEKTHVFPVKPLFGIPAMRLLVAVIVALLAALTSLIIVVL